MAESKPDKNNIANLDEKELQEIKELESKLNDKYILIAYKKDI